MLDVIAAFMSGAMVDGFAAAVETRDQVHADVLIGHALLKREFGEISLEEGLRRLRDQPGHRLRHLVGWFDAPRLVQMTDANEYREASVALNRAALKAQGEPTVDHIAAWLFAHARFQRAQAKFPLSKPAEPVKRSPRVKAAVALTAGDFSAEAQAAIVALAGGNERAGRREIAALIARGADPKGHLAAILCKLDDGHRQHVDELAATIARQTGAPRQRVATIVQAGSSGGDAAVTVESAAAGPAAQPVPDDTAEIDEAAAAVALETLRGWVERSWQYTGSGFIREAGLWVFPDTIRNPMAAAAYPIAGRSAAFQAILRERLGAAE